jgi:uncharacterized protein YndB with AHSA1/START domain
MRTEGSVVIDAPIEQVWEFMSDLQTLPQHNLSLVNVEWEPPLLVGSVATITYQVRGKSGTGTCLVKEVEQNKRLRIQMTAMGAELEGTYEMESVNSGRTKLSSTLNIQLHGLMRILSPFLSRNAKHEQEVGLGRIKRAIEAKRA